MCGGPQFQKASLAGHFPMSPVLQIAVIIQGFLCLSGSFKVTFEHIWSSHISVGTNLVFSGCSREPDRGCQGMCRKMYTILRNPLRKPGGGKRGHKYMQRYYQTDDFSALATPDPPLLSPLLREPSGLWYVLDGVPPWRQRSWPSLPEMPDTLPHDQALQHSHPSHGIQPSAGSSVCPHLACLQMVSF